MHCRADTAQIILDAGADYALAVKANQPGLLAKAKALIEAAEAAGAATHGPAKTHGRIEGRAAIIVSASGIDFPGIAAIARVETWRNPNSETEPAPEPTIVRYFLLSTALTAERMLDVARTHWTIENQLHWVLDVTLNEDASRSRMDNAPQNIALIRKLALNLLRQHPAKGSIKGKIKRAGWENTFLFSLLSHMR